jgi:molybdenum cofactor cytidylyltransferase
MSDIAGILLAAGSSRRFGADKRLLRLADGTPMVLASARNLAAACARTLVVIRPGDDEVAELLADAGLTTTVCAEAELGMGHSLACGVAATADASGWLIALADMPYIQPGSYRSVLQAVAQGARIARPVHGGRPGHPVGFAAGCYAELVVLTGDRGGKALIDADPVAALACPVDDPGVLKDIDLPA